MGLLEAGKKFTRFLAGQDEKTRFQGKTIFLMFCIIIWYYLNNIDSITNMCYTAGTRQR
jgi:hypothetical protein